jgi:hypothetical protein
MVNGRPVPHLLVTASLEAAFPYPATPSEPLSDAARRKLDETAASWPLHTRLARQMTYNQKLGQFQSVQRNIRSILAETGGGGAATAGGAPPLDLEVLAIIPRWLCGTFAFHPMLGFRRARQAESIAHGCATTIVGLQRMQSGRQQDGWFSAWGISIQEPHNPRASASLTPWRAARSSDGECWFRKGATCPFSPTALEAQFSLPERTRQELADIYAACGDRSTHRWENG